MTIPTQAQIEAAARAMVQRTAEHYGDPQPVNPDLSLTKLLAAAALTAAAEVGPHQTHSVDFLEGVAEGKAQAKAAKVGEQNPSLYHRSLANATIERCAQYHDNAAIECDKIAAVNMDNELGPDCITRAQDHRVDAAAIRKLKDET